MYPPRGRDPNGCNRSHTNKSRPDRSEITTSRTPPLKHQSSSSSDDSGGKKEARPTEVGRAERTRR